MTVIAEISSQLRSGLPAIAVTLLLLVAARKLIFRTTPFDPRVDILEQENPAAGLVFGAYLLAVAIALAGTAFGRDQGIGLLRLTEIFGEGVLAILLIRVSIFVNDRLILHRFCIVKELREDQNLGVAFTVAGSCIASGLVLNGALTGFSENYLFGLRDTMLFWFVGEFTFTTGAIVYQRLKPYDVHDLIEFDDNVAAGIGFGAFLASLGLIVRASIVHAGLNTLPQELAWTLLLALTGVFGVIAINSLAVRFVSFKTSYSDEVELHGNIAASIITSCVTLAAASLFAAFMQRP